MFQKGKIAVGTAGIVLALVTILAGTAPALSNISLKLGAVASYDFGGYGTGYPVAGTIQIHAFKMNPGDSVPWHYQKAPSYVVLAHGTLTEQHLIGSVQCASEEVPAGSAFVESQVRCTASPTLVTRSR